MDTMTHVHSGAASSHEGTIWADEIPVPDSPKRKATTDFIAGIVQHILSSPSLGDLSVNCSQPSLSDAASTVTTETFHPDGRQTTQDPGSRGASLHDGKRANDSLRGVLSLVKLLIFPTIFLMLTSGAMPRTPQTKKILPIDTSVFVLFAAVVLQIVAVSIGILVPSRTSPSDEENTLTTLDCGSFTVRSLVNVIIFVALLVLIAGVGLLAYEYMSYGPRVRVSLAASP